MFNNLQDLEEQYFDTTRRRKASLNYVAPTTLFSPYFIHTCMPFLKMKPIYDVYLPYLPCYPYMTVWILVDMLRPAVWCLVLVYLFDDSWMRSYIL
jgi:hypothetical protein